MWNELGGAAVADADGLTTSHVVHVGRSWFRMTPVTSTATKTDPLGVADATALAVKMGASLFEGSAPAAGVDENYDNETPAPGRPWGTITLSWWGLGLAAAGLMVIGAALSVAMLPRRLAVVAVPAPVAAPVVAAAPATPPAMVEPLPVAPAAKTVAAEPAVAPAAKTVAAEPPSAPVPARPVKAVAVAATAPTRAVAGVVAREPTKRPVVAPPVKRAKAPGRDAASSAATAPAEKPWVDPFAD